MATTLSSTDPLMGQLVSGRYRVLRSLGEGGMGKVYMAEHEAIEKKIALKVLHREYSANTDVVERFKQEAISASRIKHTNVIDVFDFGQLEDGSCFIAMELLEGQDLGDALQQVGAFDSEQALRIVLQVTRALGAAHARGVVHRDLKPENVFLQNTGEGEQIVKIVDFGIAQLRKNDEVEPAMERKRRLTRTGMIFGTPEYMAPEQARGLSVDARSDIYALACILYELLCGSVPFSGNSFLEVLNHHVLTPVKPLREMNPKVTVSTELETVVMKALAKSPDDRYPSMKHFGEALMATPEGLRLGRSISSMIGLGDSATSQKSEGRALVTAMHGSPSPAPPGPTPAPASHTLMEVELPRRSLLPVWVALGTFGALAVGAVLVLGRSDPKPVISSAQPPPSSSTPPPAPSVTAEPSAHGVESSVATPPPPPSEDVPPVAPQEVTIHVQTSPSGAVVAKDGFQVCDASPCDIVVPMGSAVVLSAKSGSKTGSAKVLAQRDQAVTIALGAPATSRPKPAEGPALCEVEVDGLKILRPCQ